MIVMDAKTILAVFTHPDDEIGCVGTLANHASRGDNVILAWMTYGEMTSFFGDMKSDAIGAEREEHGKKVGGIIGCKTLFLGYPDTNVQPTREASLKMASLITEIKPDAVITWNSRTRHPDHRGTRQIVFDGLVFARLPKLVAPAQPHRVEMPIFQYFEERTHYPTTYVDITESIEKVLSVVEFYADFYGWEGAVIRVKSSRQASGIECGCQYAEKFNRIARSSEWRRYIV